MVVNFAVDVLRLIMILSKVDGGGYVAFRGLDPRVDQDESHGQERDRQTTVSFIKFESIISSPEEPFYTLHL